MSEDTNAENRKRDHIDMAFSSQTPFNELDQRFYYEPILQGHPKNGDNLHLTFLGKKMKAPIWISSMTGGSEKAGTINKNLAKVCAEFGLGMGLGSCRSLLYSDTYLADFKLRKEIGEQPFFANLGIAQIEKLIDDNKTNLISDLILKLEADGLIIHINPLQEWMQPEGDIYHNSPLETIKKLIDKIDTTYIVKEVGQGMGFKSLEALLHLPIAAIDFAAFGGTNFTKLEMQRKNNNTMDVDLPLTKVGHTAYEMVDMINQLSSLTNIKKEIIISGGIQNFLDGYYLISKCKLPSVYGQASAFLRYATGDYEILHQYVSDTIKSLSLAKNILTLKA
jgi:isopentenyl-diphosphate delta-isomerase